MKARRFCGAWLTVQPAALAVTFAEERKVVGSCWNGFIRSDGKYFISSNTTLSAAKPSAVIIKTQEYIILSMRTEPIQSAPPPPLR